MMFSYQGSTIELPKPFSTNKNTHVQIFQCDDGKCDTCEKCMIKNIKRSREVLDNAKMLNISELNDFNQKHKFVYGNDNTVELPEQYIKMRNNGSADQFFTVMKSIGFTHGCFLNTERIVISLVWKSVSQARLDSEKQIDKDKNKDNNQKHDIDEDNNTNHNIAAKQKNDIVQPKTPVAETISNTKANNHEPIREPARSPRVMRQQTQLSNKVDSGRVAKVKPTKQQSISKSLEKKKDSALSSSTLKSPFFCNGKVGHAIWGCGKSYNSMLALKRHWLESEGQTCLARFIDLRKQMDGLKKAR